MPKTWSNRPYEHVELSHKRPKGLPLAAWVIFGVTGFILCFIITVAVVAVNTQVDSAGNSMKVAMPNNHYGNLGR